MYYRINDPKIKVIRTYILSKDESLPKSENEIYEEVLNEYTERYNILQWWKS